MARPDEKVALTVAALALGMTSDRVRRRVQTGALPGGCEDGKWYVLRSAIDRAERERRAADLEPVAA
jgi:hypothetical protein